MSEHQMNTELIHETFIVVVPAFRKVFPNPLAAANHLA